MIRLNGNEKQYATWVGATLLAFLFCRYLFYIEPIVSSLAVALIGMFVKSKDLPSCWTILHRTVLAICILYIFAARPSVAVEYDLAISPWGHVVLHYGDEIAIIFGAVGWFRPSLALFPIAYILWRKSLLSSLFGIGISSTDYLAVLEFGVYLIVALLFIEAYRSYKRHQKVEERYQQLYVLIVLVAIAAHFGNYFYSAGAKFALDNDAFTWILENQTHYLTLAADISNVLPLEINETVTAFTHEIVRDSVLIANTSTFAIQVLAIVGLWRIRHAITLTICYDVMHLFIFLVSGIFFWKWIILNLAIVFSLAQIKELKCSRPVFVMLCGVTVTSPLFFNTVTLGWFDSASFNHAYFMAVTNDGKEYEVPSNYFLSASVSVAQQKYLGKPFIGHFETGTWSGVDNTKSDLKERMYASNECRLPVGDESEMTLHASRILSRFVRLHHKYILSKVDRDGRFDYDLYPHHIWSNPLIFRDFYKLDKREIVAYKYIVESGCTYLSNGEAGYNVKLRGRYLIPLQRGLPPVSGPGFEAPRAHQKNCCRQ